VERDATAQQLSVRAAQNGALEKHMNTRARAASVLTANTVAFGVCFAVWVMYGVLITYLADQRLIGSVNLRLAG
jgi:hypothetical protein